ncbi:metal ABC transporter substrate-binding protein [Kyrpidia tusciae]|uniref:Periplasmic solute binding protein n=1 Tax=Kyrpidia tusciae (strain DSM 2912 / NBRC 15312 / T2) TaxID=562970 RepID=D5WSQ5_KYRT2|nr:metal ABC transporter substrate-binding protein [Kyrpidia tusciae]ADG07074.1 periplasmic solute binding protein [Kyrpidia tusciae DSM 2912]
MGGRIRRFSVFAIVLLSLFLAACGQGPSSSGQTGDAGKPASSGALGVVTSITPIADMIRQVGGDRVQVTALVPPGADPHDYSPTPADVRTISQAKLFVANGLGEETYIQKLIQSSGRSDLKIVTLSDGLPVLGQGEGGTGNPHMWLDPNYAVKYTERIRDALIEVDPAGAAEYRNRAQTYIGQLQDLDKWIRSEIAQIPADRRTMVVFHDAWPYFCKEYGLEQVYLAGSSGAEPSPQDYAKVVQAVRDRHVPAVFGEAGFNPKLISRLAEDTGVRFVDNLLDDTVGGPGTATYIDMMKFDVQTIVSALKGSSS